MTVCLPVKKIQAKKINNRIDNNLPTVTTDKSTYEQQLRTGIASLNLALSDNQLSLLLDYMALLLKWNAVYNLTAIRDPVQMVSSHLLDCLAVVKAFDSARQVLDVGAGAGLPGMILAIWAQEAQPAMAITLVDTVHKKTAFLQQVKAELKLDNVTVITGRIEQLPPSTPFDIITSRAFASLNDFVTWSQHLLADHGYFLAMKGAVLQDEIACLSAPWVVSQIQPLTIPTLDAQRHLMHIVRQTPLAGTPLVQASC